ncbi:MAG: hypothetical protein HKN26_14735 [Acidimicrobiales bacterium]|nr:hypothetical protein [Acidimicrobiales bacterium]
MKISRLLALFAALVLLASACGSDDGDDAAADPDPAPAAPAEPGEPDPTAAPAEPDEPETEGLLALRVPDDYATIQAAVDAAVEGDLILISPGVYNESVQVQTDNIVIRGLDRNEVILDGEFSEDLPHGFQVFSNGVAIENLTTRNFTSNGVFFTGSYDDDFILTGYRASYVTAHNNGDYGIYAFNASEGLFEHSYGSGHPDSAFYIGQCNPCNAMITDSLAENNALGYSGTNASGNLWIVNSEWRNNRVGMVPNTLASEELGPQGDGMFAGNYVHSNGNEATPRKGSDWDLAFGVGIVVAGGNENMIAKNLTTDNANIGIAVSFFPDGDNIWTAEGNQVVGNVSNNNGQFDLVLLGGPDTMNCFADNEYETSAPPQLQEQAACGGEQPEAYEGEVYAIPDPEGLSVTDYTEVAAPELNFENMPDAATAPAQPATGLSPTITLDDISVPTP